MIKIKYCGNQEPCRNLTYRLKKQSPSARSHHHKQGYRCMLYMFPVLLFLRRGHLHAEDDEDAGDGAQEPPRYGDGLVPTAGGVLVLQLLHQCSQESVDELAGKRDNVGARIDTQLSRGALTLPGKMLVHKDLALKGIRLQKWTLISKV